MDAAEIARLSQALAAHSNQQAADFIRLITLTGARRGETMKAQWRDVDFDDGIWKKPGSTTKQETYHYLPVSAPARELLARMKAEAKGPYLFPGEGGTGHMVEVKRSWKAIATAAQFKEHTRLHDLRHTVASILVNGGATLPLIGELLGHSNPNTTHRYAHLYIDSQREAAERVGAVITGKKSAEIVPLPRKEA